MTMPLSEACRLAVLIVFRRTLGAKRLTLVLLANFRPVYAILKEFGGPVPPERRVFGASALCAFEYGHSNQFLSGEGVNRLMTKTTAIAAIASGNSRRSLIMARVFFISQADPSRRRRVRKCCSRCCSANDGRCATPCRRCGMRLPNRAADARRGTPLRILPYTAPG